MNYFIAPRSNEKSYRKNQSTIINGVPLQNIAANLDPEGLRLLQNEEIIYSWGNRPGTKTQWEVMQNGDQVIFYSKGKLVSFGEIYYKQHSAALARDMWPVDDNGQPWEYTFFVRNMEYINIPVQAFYKAAKISPKYIMRGFYHIKGERLKSVVESYGSVEDFLGIYKTDMSEEVPKENEPIFINVPKNIDPEVQTNARVVPRKVERVDRKDNIAEGYKTDYEERNRSNAITGSKGEELVQEQEIKRLRDHGRSDLAQKVLRVSVDDDSRGYDILSFDANGKERHIEVKTTSAKSDGLRLFMTQNEYNAALNLRNYYIYYVEAIHSQEPRITILKEPIKNNMFAVKTDSYILEAQRL